MLKYTLRFNNTEEWRVNYFTIVGIGFGLAMDAFAVSLTSGAANAKISIRQIVKIALVFGLFQAAMPVIGWVAGDLFSSFIEVVDHYIAFILLGYIGGKMIYEAIKKKDDGHEGSANANMDNKTLLLMAVATSIDALVTGIILPMAAGVTTFGRMLVAISIIGGITFALCVAAVYLGKAFGMMLKNKAEIVGGAVLIFIGAKILVEHLFF